MVSQSVRFLLGQPVLVWKPKIGSDSDLLSKKPNCAKILHPFRQFFDRNCVQSTVQIISDKNNFTCIQCADEEHFKT